MLHGGHFTVAEFWRGTNLERIVSSQIPAVTESAIHNVISVPPCGSMKSILRPGAATRRSQPKTKRMPAETIQNAAAIPSLAVNSLDSPLTAHFRGTLPASTEIHDTQSCECRGANPFPGSSEFVVVFCIATLDFDVTATQLKVKSSDEIRCDVATSDSTAPEALQN